MMMAALLYPGHLINRLPKVRGSYSANVQLAKYTWFKVGGPAEVVFRPADAEDLTHFLLNKPEDVPVTVIGVGSNLLVRDGGIPGVVIRLGKGLPRSKQKTTSSAPDRGRWIFWFRVMPQKPI